MTERIAQPPYAGGGGDGLREITDSLETKFLAGPSEPRARELRSRRCRRLGLGLGRPERCDWCAALLLGRGIASFDGLGPAVAFQGEPYFLEVHPCPHERGLDVSRDIRGLSRGERNGL